MLLNVNFYPQARGFRVIAVLNPGNLLMLFQWDFFELLPGGSSALMDESLRKAIVTYSGTLQLLRLNFKPIV